MSLYPSVPARCLFAKKGKKLLLHVWLYVVGGIKCSVHSRLPPLFWSFTCRALKTKHETPKYGLIYHASLIGQSQPKFKGKISRVLAAKCALAIRVDALGDNMDAAVGLDARQKVGKAGWLEEGLNPFLQDPTPLYPILTKCTWASSGVQRSLLKWMGLGCCPACYGICHMQLQGAV